MSRGCGDLKEDSFYIQGTMVAGGGLYAWCHWFGDGLAHGQILPVTTPPRQVTFINPVGTLARREKVTEVEPWHPADEAEAERYGRYLRSTKAVGVLDHVGTRHYSAYSFAKECMELGPSRRQPKAIALVILEKIKQYGPIPLVFTHSRVPLFDYNSQAEMATGLVGEVVDLDWERYHTEATFLRDNWGMYARHDQYPGNWSYIWPMMSVIHELDRNWKAHENNKAWRAVKEFFAHVRFTEQIIGASWANSVAYTLPLGTTVPAEELANIPGLDIINLEEITEEVEQQ